MTNTLISVVGPTAIGKTTLSIALAKHFNTEIISSDSRQFYKEMSIGTAVPNENELAQAKHHFIQHISIHEDYNVGLFEKDAISKLKDIFKMQKIAIMVGGSGLYSNAIVEGLDEFPKVDKNIRQTLNKQFNTDGIIPLQKQLKELDIESYNTIAINNPQRLIRALEISIGTNSPYSSFLKKKNRQRSFKTLSIGLTSERSIIYNRINERVDLMLTNGLMDEVKKLHPYKHLNALNTVGYKELFNYLEGNWTKDFAVSEIKKNTRRFAKRQLTWYRKDDTILWFDYKTPVKDIISSIETNRNKKNQL